MTKATTIKYGLQALLIRNPASLYVAPCGITQLTKATNVETNTTMVPDCDDIDAVSYMEVDEISRSHTISGSGVLPTEALKLWDEWDREGGEKMVRWMRDLSSANGGGYYEGPGLLTQFEENGQKGQKWQVSFQIMWATKPTWVPVAA